MKRILPITIEFISPETDTAINRIQLAYNRIFSIAKRNLMQKEIIKNYKRKEVLTTKDNKV